jgi:membrane fusion protein, heavy metal efflux system
MHCLTNKNQRRRNGPRGEALSYLLGIVGLLALAACQKGPAPMQSAIEIQAHGDNITVPADSPQRASLDIAVAEPVEKSIVHLNGRLVWEDKSTVRVFSSVAGRVDRVLVSLKDSVSAEDTLATMASPDFGQAQADASKAEADVKLTERTLNRTRDLFEHGAAAKKDVEAAEDDSENKKAEFQRAVARLKLYGVSLKDAVDGMFPLKTPIAGRVVEMSINPGQEVRPDQMLANDPNIIKPLFVISDPRRLSVLLDVTELDLAHLRAGQPLQIRARAYPNEVFGGVLEVVGDSLDPQTRTVNVRGYVDNPEGLLKAEMYVSVDVVTSAEESKTVRAASFGEVRVPNSDPAPVEIPVRAVFSRGDQHFVFVEEPAGHYERKQILLGAEHDGRVCVTNGLTPGQRVVIEGSLQLQAMTEDAGN